MATWSKTELATAMGTKQDTNQAHELGMQSPRTAHVTTVGATGAESPDLEA